MDQTQNASTRRFTSHTLETDIKFRVQCGDLAEA